MRAPNGLRIAIVWLLTARLLTGCADYVGAGSDGGVDGLDARDGRDDGGDGRDDGGDGRDGDGWDGRDGRDGGDGDADPWPDVCTGDGCGGDPEPCRAAAPQEVMLQLGEDPWAVPRLSHSGHIRVLYNRPLAGWGSELWLELIDEGACVQLLVDLPAGYEAPVAVGESLWAELEHDMPWWVDEWLTLRERHASGPLRLRVVDAAHFEQDPAVRCPPQPDGIDCGMLVFPQAFFELDPGQGGVWLEQGGEARVQGATGPARIWIGDLYQYTEVWCTDLPAGWLQRADLATGLYSQCRCREDESCAAGEICDEGVSRCAPDRCQGLACPVGEICDPYRGECVPAVAGVFCFSDADCGAEQVCNRFTGQCLDDFCAREDCSPCSSRQGGCFECLHDCDCWPGLCSRETRTCRDGCSLNLMELEQDNPERFDLFAICASSIEPSQAETLFGARILEGEPLDCRVDESGRLCDPTDEIACTGSLRLDAAGQGIEDQQWRALCAISRVPIVSRVAGTHLMH
ncbi:MAG: hypothetical protein JXR96_30235 [Deltaproteobacteria bacterium]|nr:hypothetical protein [Deltaproteobacteria bacterium]